MSEGEKSRIAVLISGRGSNLQAFIDACATGELHAEIAVVISNNPQAAGLQRAATAGIATAAIDHRDFDCREQFDASLLACLQQQDIDLVILAGFMRILTPVFIEPYFGRLLNIHPSLLPKYPGLNTHQRAIDARDSEAGVTVHFVTPKLDSGPAVLQAKVPILPGDTADSLAARVLQQERKIYPLAAQWYIAKRLWLDAEGAKLDGKLIPPTGITYEQDQP